MCLNNPSSFLSLMLLSFLMESFSCLPGAPSLIPASGLTAQGPKIQPFLE